MKTNTQILAALNLMPAISAWSRGVKIYACELVQEVIENDTQLASPEDLKMQLLNGAQNWYDYSSGGSALIYNAEICERLCTPSEIKKTRNGDRAPNANETWIDCQARALSQAERMIARAIKIL